ncbi:MAG: efflux RND transporter periplasmic adaptor subunit [Thermoanaerobaculia bacterium]
MKKVLLILGALLFFGLLAIGLLLRFAGPGRAGTEVFAEEARQRPIVQLVKATGQVNARVEVNISSPLVAKIERLYVKEGEPVQAGQPFLELEKDIYLAAQRDWSSRLLVAKNEAQQAEIDLADSHLKLDRAHRLADEGIITREQLEAAQLALNSSQLRLERSHQSIDQAEANLEKARADLAKTSIFSPLTGLVVSLQAKEGEVVVSGTMNNPASVIAKVADLSEILAEVDVDESEIVKITAGQSVELRVDAVPQVVFRGKVSDVGSSGYGRPSQPDVTFFRVKVLFDTPDARLRPGMSVRADIRTADRETATVVPIQSVLQRPRHGSAQAGASLPGASAEETSVVFVVADGKAEQREVKTGLTDDTHVEIASGVAAGDKVITGPNRVLKDLVPGKRVTVVTRLSGDQGFGPRSDEDDEGGE